MKKPTPNLWLVEGGVGSDPGGSDFWPTSRTRYCLLAGAVCSPN